MSKISCFNNTKLEEVFNNSKITERFEENAAAKTIKAEYDSILAELNAIKQELELPLETSTITVSEIKFDTIKDTSALAKEYTNRITAIKEANPQDYWSVDIPSQETIKKAAQDGRIVKNNGGMAIVTEDGNLVGLFKDKDVKGVAKDLQEKRVALGGIKMDNYDGYLTNLYQKNGFRVVSRLPFNEEFAPKDWNKELHGTPDVVFMLYDPQNKLKIEEKTFTDYNEAMAYRDSFVDEARALKSGKQNTEFFEGKAKEASSNIPYKPVLDVDQTTPVAKAYALYTAGGNFTGHISKMIAGFQEKQKQVAEAIVKGGFKSFLDIGTSEGGMIKTVASQNKDMVAVGVDPNLEMQKNFNSTPKVNNAEYRLEAFQGSWTEDDGTVIKEFKTDKKFDVVNEDFAFQFINNNRAKQVKGVKELMTPNGIFVTSEKFHTANEAANELKKYDHQRKYFSSDQLTEDKQTIVSGMADDMVSDIEYVKVLKDNFKFVEEFWNAGNFKGYLASDSNETLQEFKKNVGDLTSEFTDNSSQTKFQIIGEQGASKVEQYQQSLNKAKDFEKRGLTPQQIEKQTGWFKNEQNQWKYFSNEILNEFLDVSQIKNKTADLKDLLKTDSILLKAYPELNNVKVEFYEGIKGADFRGNAQTNGTVTEEGETTILHIRTDGKGESNKSQILLHELNHKLQRVEQFARGGSPNFLLKIATFITNSQGLSGKEIVENIKSFNTDSLNKDDKKVIEIAREYFNKFPNSEQLLEDGYFLLQGEIDSRAVELALELKSKFGKDTNFTYSQLIKELSKKEGIDLTNEAISIFIDDVVLSKNINQYKNTISEKLSIFDNQIKDKKYPTVLEVAEEILPPNIFNKYKNLYEMGARNNIQVDITTVEAGFTASWGQGSINLSKSTAEKALNSFEDFAETLNHETIHGILSRGIRDNYSLNKDLESVMSKVEANFDSASQDVRNIISYIQDTRREFKETDILNATDQELENDSFREVGSLEELITYAFTNKAFADFLDSIPATEEIKAEGDSIFTQLKNIIRNFISGLTENTALDEISNILEKYLDTSYNEKNIKERNDRYEWGMRFEARGQKLNLNKNGNKQLSQTEEQGRTKAGRIAIEATNILRGSGSTGSEDKITEPKATFNGFNTYTQAVKNTPINEVIKIDINGINVAEVTNNGDINDLIRQDIILDERELTPSGDIIFKTSGNSLAKKLVNAEIAREIIKGRVNEEGNIIAREKVELTRVSEDFNKNKKEFGQEIALTILATQIIENNTPVFGNNRIIDYSIEVPSDNILMVKLKNLLQELGIKTMSFETWAENYKKRVGELPTSNALADIANKVIAFANGEITQDNLSEEVMHFVVEALPQEQIQPLLDMIHKTDEWKQYAAQYTEIYKDDNTVRREILGKVLKNYIQNQQEQTTLQGQSITRRLVELLDKFFTQIRELFKPQHQVQLDKFKEEIFQKLMAEELYSELSPEQFDGNKAIMFQTPQSPLYASLSKAVDTFKGLDKSTGGNYQYQLNEIELREFDELNQLKAASGLANTIKSYITHLNKRGKQKGFLSIEETFVYNTAEKDLRPVLNMVATVLKDNASPSPMQKRVIDEIQESLTALDELSGNLTREKQEKFKELVEKTAKEVGLTDSMKEVLVKEMETLDRDTNQFYSIYGGLAHAQNPILNMLGTTMSGMNREANLQFTQRQNSLLNVANALGFKDEQLADILKKFKDGAYFLSPYDFEKLFLEEAKIKSSIYNTISGNNVTAEELVKTEEELKLKLSQDQLKDYLFQTTEAIYKSGLYIDVLKKEERTKIESLTEGFSAKTKNHLNNLASRKRKIFKRAQDNGGLSSEDNYELQTIMHDQQKLASPYDSEGNLFKGLALDDENDVTLANGVTKEDLDEEIRTAYELNYYNQKRREDFSDEKSKAPMRFIEEFNRIKDEKGLDKAVEFLKLNSRISYNNNFWSTFDKTNGIIEKLKENDATDLAEEIQRKRIKLKNILKQHRMYNNPSQINFDEMSGTAIADVKDIVTALNSMYKEAKLILPEEIEEYTESLSETVVNEAYQNQVRDRGLDTLDQQLDFIYQHTTLDDKEIIQRNIINYKRYKNGDTTNLPKAFTRFDAKSEEENIREYAESKLLPYFKELKPQDLNVQEFVENIAKAQTAEEWNRVVEEANYVSISPAYIWLDAETSDRLNPEYNKRRENNEPLVNLNYQNGILKNAKYQEYFGMSNGIATKNEKEFALLQEVLKFQENTIASAGMEGKHNKYQLPQFRRQSMARIAQLAGNLSAKNIKEAIKDIVTIREDDPILGQTIDGQDAKNFQRGALAVPRMGFRKLETSEEVTDEVLYSVMLMAKEAEQRKQRIAALIDIESIRTELQGKQFGDKSGESTTTYKMFDDFVRYNIYGQTESFKWETDFFGLASKKQNIAPVVRQFQNWVRLVNLGFSVLTPMTSLFQGTTNFFIERFVGDRIDKDAARQARKKMPKLMTEAASEFLNVRAKGELNLMLQYFGLESPMERYMNSNYGKAVRGTAISKSAYLTHYLGDLPLTAQTVMTVLYDFKNVKGELINYSEWRNRNRSLLEKDARATWAKEEKTAYSYLETVNGEMKMKESFFTEIKDAKERLTFLKNRIATAKQEIDNQISQEDKGFIQRHSVFSFISLHKGFLISSVTKRMKSRHLNLYTGQMEEGTYAGAANFLVGILKDAKKKGLKQAWLNQYKEFDGGYKKVDKNGKFYLLKIDSGKEQIIGEYDSQTKRDEIYSNVVGQASRMRQVSIKRVMSDVLVANTLALVALLLKNLADDDDDNYGNEFLSYSVFRLATEVSSQSVGLPAQGYQFLQSPSSGISQIQNALDIFDLVNDDKVTQGSYAGLNRRQAWVFKSLPLMKEAFKVYNIDRTRTTYTHFNDVYLNNFTFVGMMMDDKK